MFSFNSEQEPGPHTSFEPSTLFELRRAKLRPFSPERMRRVRMSGWKSPAFFSFLFFVSLSGSDSTRRILSFDSIVQIHKDSSMTVTEKITYNNTGMQPKHGISREFPTRYSDPYGNKVNVGFTVQSVTLNNTSVPYTIESAANGKIIKIGDKEKYLAPGIHTFTIIYNTTRQLRFGDAAAEKPALQNDELYWNVTGNGWRLDIDRASARVILPEKINPTQIKLFAYTGYQGEKKKNYTAHVTPDGNAEFTTTEPLLPKQGLTISVVWPRGLVTAPSFLTKAGYFLRDNLDILWLSLCFIVVLLFYLRHYFQALRTKKPGTVIPLWEPPAHMSPGAVRFLTRMGYDAKAFATEIVNMAVQGLLTINYKAGWFGSGMYTLQKAEKLPKQSEPLYQELLDILFSSSDKLELSRANNAILNQAQNRYLLKQKMGYKYLNYNTKYVLMGSVFSALAIIPPLFLLPLISSIYLSLVGFILIFLLLGLNIIFSGLLKTYTAAGRKLMDSIDGFRMFLSTTETERMKIIGTPPTKTPELYEKFLPYAMALNVESAWSAQFAPVFEKLKAQGHSYTPVWYVGPVTGFDVNRLGSNLSSTIASAASQTISSSGTMPGSSTGSDDSGSSGGGGGGGGGGDW